MPLPKDSANSDHGLLCVNNEYVSPNVMFEAMTEGDAGKSMSKDQVALCNMAVGYSIVEIKKDGGVWKAVSESPLNRRLTLETEFLISGPAAGIEAAAAVIVGTVMAVTLENIGKGSLGDVATKGVGCAFSQESTVYQGVMPPPQL